MAKRSLLSRCPSYYKTIGWDTFRTVHKTWRSIGLNSESHYKVVYVELELPLRPFFSVTLLRRLCPMDSAACFWSWRSRKHCKCRKLRDNRHWVGYQEIRDLNSIAVRISSLEYQSHNQDPFFPAQPTGIFKFQVRTVLYFWKRQEVKSLLSRSLTIREITALFWPAVPNIANRNVSFKFFQFTPPSSFW